MAGRAIWDDATRGLGRRLRPLYSGMSKKEFECMVARIAEIELYGEPARRPVVRSRTKRQRPTTARRGRGRAA